MKKTINLEHTYNYFYKITNNINGKYYYGIHSTDDLNDGYMGSGTVLHRAYNKYGIENFSKEILKFFETREELIKYEFEIVNDDIVNNDDCYNVLRGGGASSDRTFNDYDLFISNLKDSLKKVKHTKDWGDNISKSLKGKPKSEEHKQKLRKPKTEEHKQKLRGRQKSEIERLHISEGTKKAMKGYFLEHPRNPEQYKKCWETRRKNGTTTTMHGKTQSEHQKETLRNMKWMTNGFEVIRVNINDIELFLNKGYTIGRK